MLVAALDEMARLGRGVDQERPINPRLTFPRRSLRHAGIVVLLATLVGSAALAAAHGASHELASRDGCTVCSAARIRGSSLVESSPDLSPAWRELPLSAPAPAVPRAGRAVALRARSPP